MNTRFTAVSVCVLFFCGDAIFSGQESNSLLTTSGYAAVYALILFKYVRHLCRRGNEDFGIVKREQYQTTLELHFHLSCPSTGSRSLNLCKNVGVA